MVSSETTQYRNSRVHVETILRQRLRGLRRVSYQLPCFNSILECAFEDSGDNACVPRQLAQLLGVPFEEVCGDFDTLAEHDWRAHGISPVEIRAFCAWRNAPMVLISNTGEPLDRFEPAQRETKTVVFTYYDGHAFFYARPVLEQMGCALVMYRRDPKQSAPPLEEWSPGHFHTTDAPRITPSQRQKKLLLAEQGGKRAACGQQIGAGCAEFDHIVPVRQAFAGQQQRLQALCFECHQMKTQTESMQPTSLESRFTRSVYDAYIRSPKQPPLVFQARAPGSGPLEGVDVVRCRRNGLANAPFPGRQHRAGAARAPRRPLVCGPAKSGARCPRDAAALRGAGLVPEGLAGLHAALRRGAVVRRAPHHVTAERLAPALDVMEQAWPEGEACSELDDRAHGARQQQGVHAAQQQQRAGRDRGRHQAGILRRRRPVRVGLHHHPLNPQQRDAAPHPRLRARLRGDDGGTHPTRTGPSAKVHQAGENGLRGAAGHAAEVPERLVHNTYPDGKPKFRHEETTKPQARAALHAGGAARPPAGRTWPTLWRTAWPADRSCSPGCPAQARRTWRGPS